MLRNKVRSIGNIDRLWSPRGSPSSAASGSPPSSQRSMDAPVRSELQGRGGRRAEAKVTGQQAGAVKIGKGRWSKMSPTREDLVARGLSPHGNSETKRELPPPRTPRSLYNGSSGGSPRDSPGKNARSSETTTKSPSINGSRYFDGPKGSHNSTTAEAKGSHVPNQG